MRPTCGQVSSTCLNALKRSVEWCLNFGEFVDHEVLGTGVGFELFLFTSMERRVVSTSAPGDAVPTLVGTSVFSTEHLVRGLPGLISTMSTSYERDARSCHRAIR